VFWAGWGGGGGVGGFGCGEGVSWGGGGGGVGGGGEVENNRLVRLIHSFPSNPMASKAQNRAKKNLTKYSVGRGKVSGRRGFLL